MADQHREQSASEHFVLVSVYVCCTSYVDEFIINSAGQYLKKYIEIYCIVKLSLCTIVMDVTA